MLIFPLPMPMKPPEVLKSIDQGCFGSNPGDAFGAPVREYVPHDPASNSRNVRVEIVKAGIFCVQSKRPAHFAFPGVVERAADAVADFRKVPIAPLPDRSVSEFDSIDDHLFLDLRVCFIP